LAGGSRVSPANDNSLIVQYRNIPSVSTQSTIASSLSVQSTQSINIASSSGTFNAQILDFANSQTMVTAQTSLEANSNVISVTPNLMVSPQVVPNDPNYGSQWAPAAMNLPAAWDTTTGSTSTVVAVLDTGVLLTHPDLINNLWTNPSDGSHGYNYVDGNTNPTDVLTTGGVSIVDAGHGTHVAGIIGAEGNNLTGGVGVNWQTSIMALRVCGPRYGNPSAGCYLDWVLQALQFAYDHGAQVINESFGGTGAFAAAERDLITAIAGPGTGLRKGALVVAAAGNSGADTTNNPFYPADYGLSNLISVGALAPDGTKASFSNYGWNSVDVLAPGQNIYSTWASGAFGFVGDYGYLSGTSMAAPEVSGLAALLFTAHPSWTPDQVKRTIIATSTWTPALAPYAFSGGIVNAQAALASSGTSSTLRLHFSGTGQGSLTVAGNATCSNDCNISITPMSSISATGVATGNTTMAWTGSCAGVVANGCSFIAPATRPYISATFNLNGGSGISQVDLNSSPDTLAQPAGSGPGPFGFIHTSLTPSGNYRLKVTHYDPNPCFYATSTTGGVTVEDNLSGSWVEEAKFTAPALGYFNWPQKDNCQNFGFTADISNDGKTVMIPISAYYGIPNYADPSTDYLRCGVMLYKKNSSNAWNSGTLIEPDDYNSCFKIFSRTSSGASYSPNMNWGVLSGDGTTAVLTGLTNQLFTVNLSAATPVISAPITLPNSCSSWNSQLTKVSTDGSLILIGVNGCTDNASALLLANNGTSVNVVESFTEHPWLGNLGVFDLALSGDGNTLAISYDLFAPTNVLIYEKRSGIWVLAHTLSSADGLTPNLLCNKFSNSGDRLLCSDMYYSVGYSQNQGVVETIDRISSSWSLGQPVPTIAFSDRGRAGDYLQLQGSNAAATLIDGTISYLQLGTGLYPDNYMGETFTIPTQALNNVQLPSIAGITASGGALSGDVGVWIGINNPTYTVQWFSCANSSDYSLGSCSQISGATSLNYTTVALDINTYLRLRITLTQGLQTRQVYSTASTIVLVSAGPAPTVTSVTPNSGSTLGGTDITITGTGFSAGVTVKIGGVPATVGVVTSTTIATTTPAGTVGAKDIVVTNTDSQTVTATGLFSYVAPVVTPPVVTPPVVTPPVVAVPALPPPPTPPPIVRIAPEIIWATPSSITSDTPLTLTQLSAALSAATNTTGDFLYNPVLGTLLPVGTQTLTVVFTPRDLIHFQIATKSVSIVVTAAPIEIIPIIPSSTFVYDGLPHNVSVDAIPAGISYSITYNGSSGAPISAGVYAVEVKITADGYFGSATGAFTIARLAPTIVWNNPKPITSDQIISSVQLNATSDVPGTFTYSPADGSKLPAGEQTLSATFTPDDLVNYALQQVNIGIIVNQPPVIRVPAGTIPPTFVATLSSRDGSTVLTQKQITSVTASATKKTSVIQIFSYVKPTGKKAADLELSISRANAVKVQLLKKSPKANIIIKAMGSTFEPSCVKTQNFCIILKVIG